MADCLNLTWQYEEKDNSSLHPQNIDELIAPPQEELEKLHQLAQWGSMKKIRQWAKHIIEQDETYHPFAKQVHNLAKQYKLCDFNVSIIIFLFGCF